MNLERGRWEENNSQNNKKSSIVVLDGSAVGQASLNNSTGGGAVNSGSSGGRQKCSQRERHLSVLVIFLSVLSFGLLVYLLVSGPLSSLLIPEIKNGRGGFTGICDSIECVDVSYRSVHSGDFRQDPCQDFYSFACSKWQVENPISDEELYSAANINQIRDRIDLHLKKLLVKETKNDTANGAFSYRSPRAFYESCLNFSAPDETYIMLDLAKSVGGYKSPSNWKDEEFDLTNVILDFLRLNAAPLFDFTLDIDPRDKTKYALVVELPRPTSLVPNLVHPFSRQDDVLTTDKLVYDLTDGSPESFVVNTDHSNIRNSSESSHGIVVDRQIVYSVIRDNVDAKRATRLKAITEQIGKSLNLTEDQITSDANDIAVLAAGIENIKPSQRSRKFWKQQNKVYNEFSIENLQRWFNVIDWKVLLKGLLSQKAHGNSSPIEEDLPVSWENIKIYVPYPDYLRRLSQVIQHTNKRLLFNGMLVLYVKDMLNDIVPKKAKENSEPRWKFCVHSTKSVFAMELSSLYLRSFDPDYLSTIRNDVEGIFLNVKRSLLRYLNQSHWQNPQSREDSIKKVESLKGNFIGPSFYLEDNYLDDGLKNIRINPKDFYANVKLVYKIFREQLYRLYWKKIDEDRATWAFVTFPTTVNAFYIQQFNSLVVPLAFLNPPHYVHGAPRYINYATIALTIAHEALHSLDSSGSDFDADGKLIDWLEGESRGFLKEKSTCVAKQYSEHFRKIMPFHQTSVFFQVDGNLTQNENLADIAGLQVALQAYIMERQFTSPKSEVKLPGLDFSLDQLYFLAVAQAYCANISPMGYIFLLEMDEHTPHPERINGMLMNIPEFSEAFKCPVGSKMNPSSKCSLW